MSRLWVQLDLQVTAVSTVRLANAIRLSGCKIWLSQRIDLCWTCLKCSQILPGNPQKNLLKFNYKASKSTKMSITLKTPRTHPKRWIDLLRAPAFSGRQLESLLWSAGRLDWYTFTSHEVQLKLSAANRGHWTTPRLATWSWGPFQTQWLASKKSNVLTLISIDMEKIWFHLENSKPSPTHANHGKFVEVYPKLETGNSSTVPPQRTLIFSSWELKSDGFYHYQAVQRNICENAKYSRITLLCCGYGLSSVAWKAQALETTPMRRHHSASPTGTGAGQPGFKGCGSDGPWLSSSSHVWNWILGWKFCRWCMMHLYIVKCTYVFVCKIYVLCSNVCIYKTINIYIYIYTVHILYWSLNALNIYDMVRIYYIIFTYIFHCLDHALERRIVVDRLVRRESHRATQWKDINLSTPDIHGGPKKTGGCCEVMRSWWVIF